MAFRYSGEGWRVAHAIRTFGEQIMALRGHTDSYPVDGTLGDLAHSSRVSDHNPDENGIVRALDFYEHKLGFVDEVFEAMRLARDPRVKYAIHDKRMFASYDAAGGPAWQWREYTGANGHVTHGHLSVLPTGDNDSRPFTVTNKENLMSISSWAQASWDWVKGEGIYSDATIPKAEPTNEQLAVFLKRYDNSVQKRFAAVKKQIAAVAAVGGAATATVIAEIVNRLS
jgi:hypothetical protein